MKIECIKEKLQDALLKADRVTGKNPTLPVLSCLLIESKNNSLIIKSTNLDLGVEISVPAKVINEGVCAVSSKVISSFISQLINDKNVFIECDGSNLLINGIKNKTIIKCVPFEDFPSIPKFSDGISFTIKSHDFVKGLKMVWYSASLSSVKPELSSVYVYSDDNNIIFVATDSFRLAEKKIKNKKIEGLNFAFLIPFKNIPEIIRILEETDGEIEIIGNKNQISFSTNGFYLVSRVIDGSFPDYRQIIPKEFNTEALVLKQDFGNVLKIANVFSDKFNQMNFNINTKSKSFNVKTKNNDIGENYSTIDAVLKGESVEINFNHKYIADCLTSFEADSVVFYLNGAGRPMVIQGVSDDSFRYLVMPMNR